MTNESDLRQLRDEIDGIDDRILELVGRRIGLVTQVGEYKRSRGLPIYDAEREREVIARLIRAAPEGMDSQVVRRVFERIIDESRRIEQQQAATKSIES